MGAWIVWSASHARMVFLCGVGLALPMFWYGFTHIQVDADTGNLVSDRLPWRRAHSEMERAFPHLVDEIQVVIDGESPEIAMEAQSRLAAILRERTDIFSTVYAPGAGEFFDRHALLYSSTEELDALAARMHDYRWMWLALEENPTIGGLVSVLDRAAADSAIDFEPAPVLQAIGGAFYAGWKGHFFTFPWSDLTRGRRADSQELRRFVLAKPILDFSSSRPAGATMATIRRAAAQLNFDPRAVRIRVTGSEAFEHESIDSALSDVPKLLIGALVLVSLVLFVALRSARLVAACLCVLFAGLAGTAAFAAVAVTRLNMISVAFAVLYVGLGIDYAIHFCLNYVEARGETRSHLEALRLTGERAGVALFLSAVTTAFCFYAFMFTDFTGVADLGKIGGTGMFISFVVTLGFLPALLSLRPFRLPEPDADDSASRLEAATRQPRPMAWLDRVVVRRSGYILLTAVVLGVMSAVLVPFVRFDQDAINMSDPDSESVRILRELLDDPNTAVRAVSMVEPDSARAETVAARLNKLDIVRGSLTLNAFVPENQEDKLATIRELAAGLGPVPDRVNDPPAASATGNPEHARRMEAVERLRWTTMDLCRGQDSVTEASARQLLFLMVMWNSNLRRYPENTQVSKAARLEESLVGTLPAVQKRLRRALTANPVTRDSLPASLRERWVAANGSERVQVLPAERLDTPEQVRDFVEAVQAEEPAITGMAVENVELGKVTVRAFRLAFGLALLATAATLLLLLGDPRASAFVLLSLLLATLLTGAAAVVFDISFNISNVITLPLLLGLGVDAGIHIVHRHRQPARDGELLDTATGRAILYAALTTMAGFGNLTLASHRAISGMGALLVVGMVSVMACTLIVLPAIMARMRGVGVPSRTV